MQFIQVELNNKARVRDNKRLVKAQAAASGHAKARQRRIEQHQRQKAAKEPVADATSSCFCSGGHYYKAGDACMHNRAAAEALDLDNSHAAMLVFAGGPEYEGSWSTDLRRNPRTLTPEMTAIICRVCASCAAGTNAVPADAASYKDLVHVPGPRGLMSASTRDPFDTAARRLTDDEHFLLQQWRSTILPALIESQQFNNPRYCQKFYHDNWLPLALTDNGMLSGLLLCSAGFTWSTEPDPAKALYWQKLTAKLKLDLITSLNKDIRGTSSGEPVTDAAICKTMMLAAEAMGMGEVGACSHHAQGLLAMIEMRGGFAELGKSTNFFRGMLLIHLLPDHTSLWKEAIPFSRKDPVWLPQHKGCHRPLKKLHLAYSSWLRDVGFSEAVDACLMDEMDGHGSSNGDEHLQSRAMQDFIGRRKQYVE